MCVCVCVCVSEFRVCLSLFSCTITSEEQCLFNLRIHELLYPIFIVFACTVHRTEHIYKIMQFGSGKYHFIDARY